ncbi:MAG: hypothetical protein HQL68_01695 [Magnetococcales bacterium]|nr:hypothetical protein [Magnetococcales bacterium]
MKYKHLHAILLILLIFTLVSQSAAAQPIGKMIFFKTEFCPWCKVFESEVLGIYSRTDEGKALPITEVTLRGENRQFAKIEKTIPYVPTFVILDNDGKERGRIFGYSRDFFWVKLDEIIKSMQKNIASAGSKPQEIDPRVAIGE